MVYLAQKLLRMVRDKQLSVATNSFGITFLVLPSQSPQITGCNPGLRLPLQATRKPSKQASKQPNVICYDQPWSTMTNVHHDSMIFSTWSWWIHWWIHWFMVYITIRAQPVVPPATCATCQRCPLDASTRPAQETLPDVRWVTTAPIDSIVINAILVDHDPWSLKNCQQCCWQSTQNGVLTKPQFPKNL